MKRLVRDGRILYVRRHFGWSFLFIGISLGILIFAWLFPSPEKKELGVALYYGVPLALAGMVATLRSQVVAIDRNLGRALFIDRRLFRHRRTFQDLSRLSVRLKSVRSAGNGKVHHYIWIEIVEDAAFLFRQQHGDPLPRGEAEQLAADLGRPLVAEERMAVGSRPGGTMIVAGTPIDPPEGDLCWLFHFINDTEVPIESVEVQRVDYEWGDMGNGQEVGRRFGPIAPGASVEIYKETDTEVRTSLTLRVRSSRGEQRILAEFGKLYRTPSQPVRIPVLGRLGKVATLEILPP